MRRLRRRPAVVHLPLPARRRECRARERRPAPQSERRWPSQPRDQAHDGLALARVARRSVEAEEHVRGPKVWGTEAEQEVVVEREPRPLGERSRQRLLRIMAAPPFELAELERVERVSWI